MLTDLELYQGSCKANFALMPPFKGSSSPKTPSLTEISNTGYPAGEGGRHTPY